MSAGMFSRRIALEAPQEWAASPRAFGREDRRLVARATLALVVANVRYWCTVAPVVRAELARWRGRAGAIVDPGLRELALAKLAEERFNAEAGAMCATLAPRAHRRDAIVAIVALEVLFDLLDGLTEQPLQDPLVDGERLFAAFTDALRPRPGASARAGREPDEGQERDYLGELSDVAAGALARLPARAAIVEVAAASAQRAAEAQIRMHAAPRLGTDQLREWAQAQAAGTGLRWRELLAGAAASVLVVHALIAASADARTTPAQAARIAEAYLSICVLLTLLDGLVDRERDERAGALGYIDLYPDRERLDGALGEAAVLAASRARALADGPHHVMMLAGVVAYYASAPGAGAAGARPLVARLRAALAPPIVPALFFMRAWRLARGLRGGSD